MAIKDAIAKVSAGKSLGVDEASDAMEEIVQGVATPSQIAAFAVGLRMKGETAEEVAGLARVMRRESIKVKVNGDVVDTCGTGGDGQCTFNISTVAAFVASGAGARVAKHGNRGYSSPCGSADVLEALGVAIDLQADEVAKCVDDVGIGFMFAPMFHPALKHASGPRKEIGIRTVFNILGPLANPAGATAQVIGVPSSALGPLMGGVLGLLGSKKALIVHGADGMDEMSLSGATEVVEVDNGRLRKFAVEPESLGMRRAPVSALTGGTARDNAAIAEAVLRGERGPRRDVVVMNAAAALYAAGRVGSLAEGVEAAGQSIDSGAAAAKLLALRGVTQALRESRVQHVS